MTPTPLNKTATAIFLTLTEGLNSAGDHKVFDAHAYTWNWDGGTMATHVEHIGHIRVTSGNNDPLPIFSIAHYYKQNGDMMRDPDMTFIEIWGKVYPASFEMSGLGKYEESLFQDPETKRLRMHPKQQRDHASFANTWMKNIKEQQNL